MSAKACPVLKLSAEQAASLGTTLQAAGRNLAEFTPEEQACISETIAAHPEKPQDQAVAIAISECAPDKAQKSASLQDHPAARLGGGYTATQNSDGSWNLLDVPIACEATAKELGTKSPITEEWLQGALLKAQARMEADQYAGPLHINHHDDGDQVVASGRLVPKAVKPMMLEGKERATLFADLVSIPASVFAKIEEGRIPYRSVEILDIAKGEINSLAMMSHRVPFFRLPMTTVGTKLEYGSATENSGSPVEAVRAAASGARAILFRFGGVAMKDEKKAADGAPEPAKDGMTIMQEMLKELMGMVKEALGAKKPEEKPAEAAAAAADGSKTPAAIAPLEPNLAAAGIAAAAKTGVDPASLADLKGQVVALRARVEAADKEKATSKMVADAKATLKGYHLPDSLQEDLDFFAGRSKEDLDRFVASVKKHMPADPPKDLSETFRGVRADYPDAVLKLSAKGPEALTKGKRLWDEFAAIQGRGGLRDMKFERYCEIQDVQEAERK